MFQKRNKIATPAALLVGSCMLHAAVEASAACLAYILPYCFEMRSGLMSLNGICCLHAGSHPLPLAPTSTLYN